MVLPQYIPWCCNCDGTFSFLYRFNINAKNVNILSFMLRCCLPGNWAVITCPCGIVYSVKFNLRAESPRDFVDLLLSWKHFPNVTVCDYASALALHANRRQPGIFGPFQGRLLDPTPQNIKRVSDGSVHVNLPWLKSPKMPPDKDGHPLTGCSQHLSLSGTSEAQMDLLRQLELVPELVGSISSRRVEQLFQWERGEKKDFVKRITASAHLFLQRNLLHHYNMEKNKSAVEQYSKIVPANVEMQWDDHGRLVLGKRFFSSCLCPFTVETYLFTFFHRLFTFSWEAKQTKRKSASGSSQEEPQGCESSPGFTHGLMV